MDWGMDAFRDSMMILIFDIAQYKNDMMIPKALMTKIWWVFMPSGVSELMKFLLAFSANNTQHVGLTRLIK